MAAPVFDLTNQIVAGITVTIPKIRFNREKEVLIKNILLEASAMLSQLLGFHNESIYFKQNKV